MKTKKETPKKTEELKKKKYQKPRIVHTSEIQTLAGSCDDTSGCTPNYS